MQKPIKISVFLPPELHTELKMAAMEAGLSISMLVRLMVEKKYGKKVA